MDGSPEGTRNESEYVSKYEIQLSFPAVVLKAVSDENASGTVEAQGGSSSTTSGAATSGPQKSAPKTNNELIQMRLLEAGVQFETPVSLGETVERLDAFCQDLERTGCFNRVAVELGGGGGGNTTTNEQGQQVMEQTVNVLLDEKNWYRLHLGGGVKAQELLQQPEMSEQGPVPIAAELEATAGIRNLAGVLDQSSIAYRLDTKGIASWTLLHERPFYTFLPSPWREAVLETATGSRFALTAKAALDTLDYEYTRSYREYQRLVSLHLSNQHSLHDNPLAAALTPDWYASLSWSFMLRDIVPRRQANSPWLSAASPSILQEAGPSLKHSISALVRTNGTFLEEGDPVLNPTNGWQAFAQAEVATPPGDVQFGKIQAGAACHVPLTSSLSLHWLGQAGWLKPFSWITPDKNKKPLPPTVSDRFHIGGPLQIPGFLPAGIGPRDTRTGSADSLVPGGDSVGGDLYYRTSLMASIPALTAVFPDGRAFGFLAAGTCVQQANLWTASNKDPVASFFGSTRASIGVGFVTTAMAGSRLEVTYAWPLRYAPVDARRNFQLGIGVSLN